MFLAPKSVVGSGWARSPATLQVNGTVLDSFGNTVSVSMAAPEVAGLRRPGPEVQQGQVIGSRQKAKAATLSSANFQGF